MIVIRLFFLALFSVLLGASLLNLVPFNHWLIELNRNFGAYYLVIHCLLIPIGIWLSLNSRKPHEIWISVCVNVLMFVYYSIPLVPLMFHYSLPSGDLSCDKGHTALFLQIDSKRAVRESQELIERFRPTIVFLVAYPGAAQSDALQLLDAYPSKERAQGPHKSELAIASTSSFALVQARDLGQDLPGALIVELRGERVPRAALGLIVGVNPLSDQALDHNILVMRRGSAALRSLGLPSLTAVSLRMTPHSKLYQVFKEGEGLRDLFSGKGLVRTWSGRSDLVRFHYDQFFVQGAVMHADVSTIPLTEFDHLPIISALRFCQ